MQSRLTGSRWQSPTTIEVWPLDTVVWPSGIEGPERFVSVRWPLDFTGVQLAGGEVAVLDGAGNVVATTGSKYQLKGQWAVVAAIGGQYFGKPPWIDGYDVCGESDSVIPK